MAINRAWVLRQRPDGEVLPGDLALEERSLPVIEEGQVLVRNIYLSLDPTNRIWMSDVEQYLPPVQIGEVMRGTTIGVVQISRSASFVEGDIVLPSFGGWQDFTVSDARTTQKIRTAPGIALSAYLSVLGPTGITAYFGLLDVARPVPGETVVISAAAGAVGSIVGQIAKIHGCRVVGIAGGAAKCGWLTDELGFDGAVDYRREDVGEGLDRLCPNGIDVAFENVGGEIMNAAFSRLKRNGRMAVCGFISSYNSPGAIAGPADFGLLLMRRITIRGFIVLDYLPRAREALSQLGTWIGEGRIKWKDHVVEGLENAPTALGRLFTGDHDGKLLIGVSPPP